MAVVSVPGIELHLVKPVPLPPRFVWLHTPLRWVLSSWRYDGLGGGVTEERNHGMVWVGSSLEGYVVPTPLPWSGNLPPDQVTGSPHPTWPWTPLALWSLTTTLYWIWEKKVFPAHHQLLRKALQPCRGVYLYGSPRVPADCLVGACPCVREHQEFAFVTFLWMQQRIEELTIFLHEKLHLCLQVEDGYNLNLQCWHCHFSSTQHFVKCCASI